MMRKIIAAAIEPPTTVRITFDDGSITRLDFADEIAQGGVFSALADAQVFRRVSIGPAGRSLCWPNDVDFCADALWLRSQAATEAPGVRAGG